MDDAETQKLAALECLCIGPAEVPKGGAASFFLGGMGGFLEEGVSLQEEVQTATTGHSGKSPASETDFCAIDKQEGKAGQVLFLQ